MANNDATGSMVARSASTKLQNELVVVPEEVEAVVEAASAAAVVCLLTLLK